MNLRSTLLAALSGLLLASTFPVFNLHLLSWVALIPLLYALNGQTAKNGFLLGGITGLVFFAGTVHWVTNSVHFYGNVPLIPASLITLLLCAYLALYPALFGAIVARMKRNRPILLLVGAPAFWTALELARTYVFSGFPWALLGYSQYTALPVIQIADITGVYGVSFLIVFVNTAFAEVAGDRRKYRALIPVALVLTLVLAYGYLRLGAAEGSDALTVSVIQGNIDQDKKWDPAFRAETIGVYNRLTREAVKQHPDLVIWPETATPFYFTGANAIDRKMTEDLAQFIKQIKVPLLFGSPTYEYKQPRSVTLRNSAFLLGSDGNTVAKYDKFHLVPFGEYIPLRKVLFFLDKMVQAIGDFESGSIYTIMPVPSSQSAGAHVKVSTVICYEIIFPDLVRRFVDQGAGVLTTITNDAWFGRTAAPYQHFSMAVLRAVENRVPVARAANTGISGFIDGKGRILGSTGIFTEAYLTETIKPGRGKTFYTRFGDIFAYLCLIMSLFLIIKSNRPSPR